MPGGRPSKGDRARNIAVATKLSVPELEVLDEMRGVLDRATFLRWLVLDARKRGVDLREPRPI